MNATVNRRCSDPEAMGLEWREGSSCLDRDCLTAKRIHTQPDPATATVFDRGFDPHVPNAARIYDYLLGGKDNYAADQLVAQRMLAIAPDTRMLAWFSRQFLIRCVEDALDEGIWQFIDLGAGIPISPAVHEVAQKCDPLGARVLSVDYDPMVFAHANAMIPEDPAVRSVLGDLRDPLLIDQLRDEKVVDFDQPVAVMCVGVLHHIMDGECPGEILGRFRKALAPNSVLAVTHGSSDSDRDFVESVIRDTACSTAAFRLRSDDEIVALLDDFEILPPGVVTIQDRLGGDLPPTTFRIVGGMCYVP
ncbi:SAM-dependent methyltransferase [Nocardia pseudobrasiliensis]|nr:SAM-dependent methyltransferase [Nocardia pseudobrasiliensis]